MSQNRKITDPPTNVKEAIDWLIRIGELDKSQSNGGSSKLQQNCTALYKAIKALTGSGSNFSNDIKTLISDLSKFLDYSSGTINGGGIIKKDGNYTSAYNQNAAQWPTCSKGGTCSCCTTSNNKCNCTASPTKSCDGSCCNKCDIRICAGIFVALVPALETALRGLKDKCSAEAKKNGNSSKKIHESPYKEMFEALGYQEGYLNDRLTGSAASSKLINATAKLKSIKENIKRAFENTAGRPNQNGFTAPTSVVSASQATNATSPRTIREMLLWLMGLPYCQNYKDFVDELKKKKDTVSSTRTPSKDDHYLHRQLSAVIFHLPTVFYAVEGRISYLKEVFEQFNDKAKPRFCYPTEGDKLLNTLSAYVAVCYPILKYLMQRCDVEGNGRSRRGRRGAGAGTTPTEEKDGSWGDCLVSGNENSSGQVKSSDVSGSTVPKTALRDYLVFMGFKSVNGTVTGDDLYEKALKDCFSESVKTDDEDEDKAGTTGRRPSPKYQKLPALRKLAKKVLQGLYSPGATGGVAGAASGGGEKVTPTTIRQMMLWLIGLPLTAAYKSSNGTSLVGEKGLVLQEIEKNKDLKALEQSAQTVRVLRSTSNATGKHFKQQLKDSIVGMIMLFQRIEGGVHSVVEFLKGGFKDGGAKEKFKYEQDQQKLFTEFNTYVYKVHVQLRFLKVMCKTGKNDGGWRDCQYDDTSGSGVGSNITCGCSYMAPCCALPLKHFLTNNGTNNGQNKNTFQLCNDKKKEHLQMGFKAYDPQSSSGSASTLTGSHIYNFLKDLIDPINTPTTTPKPLSLLTQYCVAIGNMDPVSLGDHFDLFRELANGMWKRIEGTVKGDIKGITKGDNEGTQAGNALKGALQAVWPGSHNGNPHPSDLMSLTGCAPSSSNCSPFVASLSYGLYKYVDPKQLNAVQNGIAINWIYMKMSSLYGKLTKLKDEMTENCQCCQEGNPKPGSPCPGISQCPSCLPQLYKMGLVFGDPLTIVTNKCSDLMDMMDKILVATTSKLCVVFKSIDSDRFWPYLLFSAMVVKGKNGKFTQDQNGDDNYNCYTYALGGEYEDTYLKEKKDEDKKTAEKNKSARDEKLKCTCSTLPHQYTAPQTKQVTPTIVTLTLYFQKDGVTTKLELKAPHHYPFYNPLVRLYPRNLKAIVDWLLRIGQTRLGQEGSGSGIEEMCENFMPVVNKCVTVKDDNCKDVFQQLVQKVMSLMGLENKGNKEVGEEVKKELDDVKKKIGDKLNGNGEGFDKTFQSILTFSPKNYIDKVIEDFGKQVCNVTVGSEAKNRSYWCVAKAVSKCMKDSLQKIQNLAQTNKTVMANYSVTITEDLTESIDEVSSLTTIEDLKKLCEGFQKFHGVYDKVTKAFNSHLSTAQQGGASTEWTKIKQCVEAFNELGQCVKELGELNGMSTATQMKEASKKLEELATKLEKVIQQLNGDEIKDLSEKVTEFINKLDGELKTKGMSELETALQLNDSKVNTIEILLKTYISNLLDQVKKKNDQNNTVCDIHLRVRNDLQQLSECLKVMCEVCSTGMKEFAKELKTCVLAAKKNLDGIDKVKRQLHFLKLTLELFNSGSKFSYDDKTLSEQLHSSITVIHSLLKDPYIYQTHPIVKDIINSQATSTMTTYLKSLPDLIRDRYVLQKWHDNPHDFCGVQEFKDGIVKPSGISTIKSKLQELLKDTYHTDDQQFPITIHDFQVKSLIYNFCHKEAMEKIIAGLEVLQRVGCKEINATDDNGPSWNTIKDMKEKLSPLLTKLSDNAYLRYFATHLRDSVGYHTLSNTLGALEQVKEKLGEKNGGQPTNWNEISKLLQKTAIDQLHQRLSSLLDKLNREYIFEYPPFDWQKSCKRLVREQEEAKKAVKGADAASRARRSTSEPSPSTTAPTTCDMCVPSMAHIFIGFVPQMYRLFKMLREMTTKDGREHKLVYENNGTDAVNKCVSSLAGILSREGWRLKLGSGISSGDHPYDLNDTMTGKKVYEKVKEIIGDAEPGVLLATGEASTANASLKSLDKLFKAVMQHFRKERDELRKEREKKLRQEYDAEQQRTKSGLKFQAPPPVLPSTVRQVLFWLHELDTNQKLYEGLTEHIKNLCQRSSITISQETILHVLKLSATQCLEVLATIEDPGRQNAQYYYELYTEEHYYAYPTVNIPLFFYTFVEKLMGAFLELNFVCVQCEFVGSQGGWSECHIGNAQASQGDYSKKEALCKCVSTTPPNSATNNCPRPLYSFLFSDQKNQLRIPSDVSQRSAYMSKGTMPCGFQLKNKAITDAATPGDAQSAPTPTPTSMTGSVLVEPLRKLVGGHVTGRHTNTEQSTLRQVIYLRDLLRYVLCLAVRPPWSMSENMAFFYRVTESWKKNNNVVGVRSVAQRNAKLLGAIHAEIDRFPGTFEASLLTSAVERFAGIEDNNKHDKRNASSSNGKHQYDLRTLMGCQELNTSGISGTTVQCSPFMFPLSLDVYTHFDHKNSRAYLSWILNFAFGIYGQLRGLEEMIKGSVCIRNASQCPSLPMCPGVLTALYQSGSSFMDQGKLADVNKTNTGSATTTRKTCKDLHTVLSGLFNCNTATDPKYCTPLHNLIVQCEAFLWSIRLPFSLVQLSLWSVAILFISYVFVVPLDHFKIKSHLFNRLKYTMHPSLLIADGQRKVSEVAYFSL